MIAASREGVGPESLAGKRIVLTGGSMGIGLATAKALAERGARLTLVARDSDALEAAVASLRGEGHDARAFDVSDEEAWRRCAAGLGGLDGLVCAAAVISPIGLVGSYEPSEFRRTIEINLLGTYLGIHYCLPSLRASRGSVVTFGGGGATAPQPRYDAYAASKAAVARLTENLGIELAPHNVRVNCVAPGFVLTRMHDATISAGPEAAGREYYELTRERVVHGAQPVSEAAELVCTLLAGVPFTGKLVSAQWDPWRDPLFQRRLADDPAFGTVRRIDGVQFDAIVDGV